LGIVTLVFGTAGYLIVRPPLRRALALLATALALPFGYQIFRMGYYGELVPNTAIEKEAQSSNWGTGWDYAENFISPYHLWLPLLMLALVVRVGWWRRDDDRTGRANLVAPAAAAATGVIMAGYVIKVGGDFMHGRMLLPATFCLLLPVMLVPLKQQ